MEIYNIVGAVHLESGHPHLQVMIWSKQRDKMNYFVNYKQVNKMRDEFSNLIFNDDLIELYKKKDNGRYRMCSAMKSVPLYANQKEYD